MVDNSALYLQSELKETLNSCPVSFSCSTSKNVLPVNHDLSTAFSLVVRRGGGNCVGLNLTGNVRGRSARLFRTPTQEEDTGTAFGQVQGRGFSYTTVATLKQVKSLKTTTSAPFAIFFHAYEISIFLGPVNNQHVIFRAGHILLDTFACTFLKLMVL